MIRDSVRRVGFVAALVIVVCGASLLVQAEPPQEVGTWASIGASPYTPIGAATVPLPDGRTLIAGGRVDGMPSDAVVVFDPAEGSFNNAGQLTSPRVGHTATLLTDGRVLIAGGTISDLLSADIEIFDPSSGTSTLAATMTTLRSGHAAARLADGKVLIAGGTGTEGVLQSAEIFDPTTGAASLTISPMQMPRTGASATTLVDGRVLIAGGSINGIDDLASAEIYNPSSQSFQATDTNLAVPRSGHAAVLLPHNNSVLIAGGASSGVPQASVDLFLPAEFPDPYSYGMGRFAPTGAMAAPRSGAAGGPNVEGYAFVVGGGAADAEVYRFATIKTDKDDYAPGEAATITGSGWQPGEEVTLLFQEDPAVHDDYALTVTADPEGNIFYDQWAPEEHDLNVRFYLIALGGTSQRRAQITFTDSRTAITGSVTDDTVVVKEVMTASVTVTTAGGGGNDDWSSTRWTFNDPAATTGCADTPDHTSSGTFTESFSLTAPPTTGTFNVTFTPFQNANCAGAGGGNVSFTVTGVAVSAASTTTAITSDSPDPSNTGQAVTVQVLVSPVAPSTGTISEGTVTVNATGGLTCTTGILSAGVANCQITFATAGAKTITATYDGTSNYVTSTSAGESHTVNVPNTAPTADPQSPSVLEDALNAPIALSGSDTDSASLTFAIVTGSTHGTLGSIGSVVCTPSGGGTSCTASVPYTPTANYNGPDSFTYRVNDGSLDSTPATVSITVTPVNDAPSFTKGADPVTVLEDSGAYSATWATAIADGDPEVVQTVNFIVSNDNPSLFSVQPAIAPNGTLTFTPASNGAGSAIITVQIHDDGGTANGGVDTSAAQTFTINVTGVNDEPSFTKGADPVTVNEDSGAYSQSWATAINDGDAEANQTLTFHVSNDNNALFSAQPAINSVGTLTFTPAANANGSALVSVNLTDDGGTANGGDDTSPTQTFTITVDAVNDAPSFTKGTDPVTVFEDSGAYSAAWATAIADGDPEVVQTVNFIVSNDNNGLFATQPTVAANGTLTFTPAANVAGSAIVTVQIHDDGGTANGGVDTSAAQTFTINVTAVNDEPSFTKGPDPVTVNEDSGAYSAAWATAIDDGDPDAAQGLTFHVTNADNALFSAQPAVDSTGTLTFTPAANANGSAVVSVYLTDDGGTANGGDDTSPAQTFTITVNAVNDAPSFTKGTDPVTVLEDSGTYTAAWATAITDGDPEVVQAVNFIVSNDNNALFATQPSIAADGTLTFTPAPNAAGSAIVTVQIHDDGGTANGGVDTSAAQTFTINVTAVNDEPNFTKGTDPVTVNEDSGAYSQPWATAISDGDPEADQALTFHVSNDNNALFSSQPAISSTGTLTFTPAANANGSAVVSVYLTDDGGTANGGDDTSATQTFTINVTAVNDAPSFTKGADPIDVFEDSGAHLQSWATGMSAGPPDESGQALDFIVSNNNNALFASQPVIAANGTLSFTPAGNANGTATVTVQIHDNGGTANGGVDTSAAQTFTINVTAVNDAPSFTKGADPVTVLEDSGAYSQPWATGMSAGPPDESGQALNFLVSNNNNALFASQPVIAANGTLSFTPAANANGTATVTVQIHDNGGTANGGVDTSAAQTFTINVTAVNDVPSFTKGDNQTVLVNAGPQSVPGWATNLSAGPPDESGQALSFIVTNSNNALFSVQPAIAANGTLTFTPALNAAGSAIVNVQIHDNGGTLNGGVDTSAVQTFVISVIYSTGSCLGSPGREILQPINPDGSSVIKKGSTVPAKFRVCDANGNSIGTPGVVTDFRLYQIANGTTSDVNEAVDSTPAAYTEFRWSASDQQWIFNISTKGYATGTTPFQAGKTYRYRISLNDGSEILFQFGVK